MPRSRASRRQASLRQSKPARLRKPRMKDRLTYQDINRLGTRDAALDDELWGEDEDEIATDRVALPEGPSQFSATPVQGGTTAGVAEVGPPQQDSGRYTTERLDPEQAQEEAIER
jgi:hypothetical protein